jgi:Spy/CpxP family protein refolding chaperone
MKKLLLIAVVVAGTSALVLAGRGGGFGRQGFAGDSGWMHSGPGGFGQRGFANGPGWMHQGPGGRGQFGPLCDWRTDETPPLMLGTLELTDEQKETITTIVEESRAKLHADIEAVLTVEQVEKLEQSRESMPTGPGRPGIGYPGVGPRGPLGGPDGIPPALEALDLTEEQNTSIEAIREKARTDAEAAETWQARRDIMQAAHDEILALLTEEQIEKLEQLRENTPWGPGGPGRGYPGVGPRGPLGGPDGIPPALEVLDLTEEQNTSIEAIREKARTDAEAAETWQARRDIMQAAHDEILALLTDEQIEALEQSCPRAPRGPGGLGRGRW